MNIRKIYQRAYDGKPEGFSSVELPNAFLGTFKVLQQLEEDAWTEQFIGVREEDNKLYMVSGDEVTGRCSPEQGGIRYSIVELENLIVANV